jgi:hypothetical protein
MMMLLSEDPSILHWLSAWWSRSRPTRSNVAQHHIRRECLQRTSDAYQKVALKRSHYSAAYWRKMAEDYRNKMGNVHISDRLRNYYENEARSCDAEAEKIKKEKTDR